jgi:hypothetical protein
MNEPIISPWLIYWVGRLDVIHGFFCAAGFILTMAVIVFVLVAIADSINNDDDANKSFLNFLKKLTCVALIVDTFAFLVPTRDEAIAMYAARYITPANIKATGEFADKAVDKLIEKILKASKAIKE